ncbi:MAG: DUF3644 domain-containing protein [Candidatus Dormibacteria bacterium]
MAVARKGAKDHKDSESLVAAAREAALSAVRIYNDPAASFRTQAFIVLMIVAWNGLLQAILRRRSVEYYERDSHGSPVLIDGQRKVSDTWQLIQLALDGPQFNAIRANLDLFLRLRHQIAHRYLPGLDAHIMSEAQAMLLNFEKLLVREFGEAASLGDRLTVPLQLSAFRGAEALSSLRKAQAQLPTDVLAFLDQRRSEVDEDVLRSSDYAMPIFFVPVAANRDRAAEAVVRFLNPADITPEVEAVLQQIAVVIKPKRIPVASGDLLRPMEVVEQVRARNCSQPP